MEKIYKYPLSLTQGLQYITMPEGAEIVHFAMQGEQPCMWARVNPLATMLQREFWILGTGHDIFDNLKHIGTTQHESANMQGSFVWHLFEEKQ